MLYTEMGQRVLRHARTILAAHDAALDDLGATEPRLLTIGATEHGADVLLPALTSVLRERLPDRRPRFRLDRNVSLADAIDRGAGGLGDHARRVGTGSRQCVGSRCAEVDFGAVIQCSHLRATTVGDLC
jgi:DNA-binding transcriptional LysR family regulator